MSVGELVTDLQGLGYELCMDGVNLHFRYIEAGDPPERAAVLLEQVKENKSEVIDYLRLLQTPQAKLEKPILIESGYLKDTLYLVANEAQVREIEREGKVCYLPGEIGTLLVNSDGMDEEALKGYLTKIHQVKKTFEGSRIQKS